MNATQIIDDVLGGTAKAAASFGVTNSAICNWKAAGRFPARLHMKIWLAVCAAGHAITPGEIPISEVLPPKRKKKESAA